MIWWFLYGAPLVAVGIYYLVTSISTFIWRGRLIATGVHSHATIVGVVHDKALHKAGRAGHVPMLKYEAYGKTLVVKHKIASIRRSRFKIQKIVEIAYDYYNPTDVVIANDSWYMPKFLFQVAISVVWLVLGLSFIVSGLFGGW